MRSVFSVSVLVCLAALKAQPAHALPAWPEVAPVSAAMSVFKDYQDPTLFYFVPKTVQVAKNDVSNATMINHAIFFNKLNPKASVTQYHLTFEPVLTGKEIDQAQSDLRRQYGPRARLVPLPITTAAFEVTEKYAENGQQNSSAFSVYVPNWTGDLHSFNQRFSVVMKGLAYASEPAMARFMTNPAGNAFVGTMHYGFRGVQVPFKGHAVVNIHQFVSKLKMSLSVRYGFWAKADISAAIERMKDDQSVFVEVVKDEGYESQVWKALMDKLIATVFEPLPQAPEAPQSTDNSPALFSISSAYSEVTKDRKLTIDLKEAVIKNHSGDVDVVGGGVEASKLDQNIRYFCDMWEKFDRGLNACKVVCEPAIEFYNPATKVCEAAFGN